MAILSDLQIDPTLEAMHAAIVAREIAKPHYKRNLGVGKLGDPCERKIFYHINDAPASPPGASLVYAGEDGHLSEDVVANRLRLIPGIELWTIDRPTGKQYGFKDLDGRLKGYADGVILGLLQAPKSLHIWENKAKSVKLFGEFQREKQKNGDKHTLINWNFEYYVQAQMLMGYSKFFGDPMGNGEMIDRHYMTVCSQGARAIDSCRTEFDPDFFEQQKKKAARIISTTTTPERISQFRNYFVCKMCDFQDHCWKDNSDAAQ